MITLTTPVRPSPAPAPELSGDVHAALINLAGKRRYLSQRVVLYAVLASIGREAALATAWQALDQLQEAHSLLMAARGSLPGVYCEALRQAYFGELDGDARLRAFLQLASESLSAIANNTIEAPALLARLEEECTPILHLAGGLTLIYEGEAKRAAIHERKLLQTAMEGVKSASRRARMAALEQQLLITKSGLAGSELATAANALAGITGELETLVDSARAHRP